MAADAIVAIRARIPWDATVADAFLGLSDPPEEHERKERLETLMPENGTVMKKRLVDITDVELDTALFDWYHGPDHGWGDYRDRLFPELDGMRVEAERGQEPTGTLNEALEAVHQFISRFVVFANEAQEVAVTLWVAHAYLMEQWDATPYLHITSAVPESGKTRLLEVLEVLVPNPWRVVSPSEAVLFRKISRDHPTLLFDEIDPIFRKNNPTAEPLRALMNAGYQRGNTVPRVVPKGNGFDIEEFNVFGPKALAGIGNLPDTITSRSIRIRLKPKLNEEPAERFRRREIWDDAQTLRENLGAHLRGLDLREARPIIPEALSDRQADVWEPLLAIADVAGGWWASRSRDAAQTLAAGDRTTDQSMSLQLLEDCQTAFSGQDKIATEDLLEGLRELEDSPWADWYGKPLPANQLAKMLKPFDVHPKVVRIGKRTPRGYTRDDFEDAWKRYLPDNRSLDRNSATSQLEWANSDDSSRNTVADENLEKVSQNGQCCGVAAEEAVQVVQAVLEAFPGSSIVDESAPLTSE